MLHDKNVDLPPDQWRAQDGRQKLHEPFFGSGAIDWVYWVIGFGITWSVVHYFIVR